MSYWWEQGEVTPTSYWHYPLSWSWWSICLHWGSPPTWALHPHERSTCRSREASQKASSYRRSIERTARQWISSRDPSDALYSCRTFSSTKPHLRLWIQPGCAVVRRTKTATWFAKDAAPSGWVDLNHGCHLEMKIVAIGDLRHGACLRRLLPALKFCCSLVNLMTLYY